MKLFVAYSLITLFVVYIVSYAFWINYVSTGVVFSGDVFGQHAIHVGMQPAIYPRAMKLETIYFPMMILDAYFGRLILNVG